MLVIVEGIDGSGKTTFTQELAKTMPKSVRMAFPNRTNESGKVLNQVLSGKSSWKMDPYSLQMLFSINRRECLDELNRHLKEGTTVILDRYFYSGIVYGALDGVDEEFTRNLNKGLPVPDVVVHLKIDPTISTKRISRKEMYDSLEKQKCLAEGYIRVLSDVPSVITIDTGIFSLEEAILVFLKSWKGTKES